MDPPAIANRLSSRTNGSHSGTSSNYTLVIFGFLIAVFLDLLNLKFQPANTQSPFETHGLIMSMFVTTILVYVLTLLCPEITSKISFLSGSLAPILLSLILFPGLGRFILLIWLFYLVKLIYHAFAKPHQLHEQLSSSYVLLFNQLLAHPAHHDEEINRHDILGFPITVLLALMPLRFPSNEGHMFNNWVLSIFIITTLIYTVACVVQAKLDRTGNSASYQAVIISKICLLSGSFATVLLVLIIVRPLGWFILLLWTLLFVKLVYDGCQRLHQLYDTKSVAAGDEAAGDGVQRKQNQQDVHGLHDCSGVPRTGMRPRRERRLPKRLEDYELARPKGF